MTHVTTILGKEVGVQFQGTQDNTNFPSLNRQSNLLMLVEGVQRGRLDDVMQVTHGTLKSKLGFDRENLEFQAVQDTLLEGVPSVMVLRCFTEKEKVAVQPVSTPVNNSNGNSAGNQTNNPVDNTSANPTDNSSDNSNSDSSNDDNATVKPVVNPVTGETKYEIYVDGALITELTLNELKQGFTHGTVSISWDENAQQFTVTGAKT